MMMFVVLRLPWLPLLPLLRAERGIEPDLSGVLTESMNHYYWSCCLLPGAL